MASDDNGQFWEQSLLLKFRIEFGNAKARSPRGERARNVRVNGEAG
jgi:hypothetical protein